VALGNRGRTTISGEVARRFDVPVGSARLPFTFRSLA
jgi:hypothetical protein